MNDHGTDTFIDGQIQGKYMIVCDIIIFDSGKYMCTHALCQLPKINNNIKHA